MPPDVTADDELLFVGAEEDEDDVPVVPELPVVLVVAVVPEDPDAELPLLEVDVDAECVLEVAAFFWAVAPGWSLETTTPMATVAPVATTITPRVSVRTRDRALSLSPAVLGWGMAGMLMGLLG